VGLITRAGSRRDWHKKFWRNVGEVVDLKVVFPDARLVSLNLGTEPKEELVAALASIVDRVVFPPRSTRELLDEWVKGLERVAPKNATELLHFMRHAILSAAPNVKHAVDEVATATLSSLTITGERWAEILPGMRGRSQKGRDASEAWRKPPSL